MSQSKISEEEGCAILKNIFEVHGYNIAEHVAFDEHGLSFNADGWDAKKRVGYEYITDEAGDRSAFTPEVCKKLEMLIGNGALYFFLVDENEGLNALDLEEAATAFLARVQKEMA